jgi:hypothetical protein
MITMKYLKYFVEYNDDYYENGGHGVEIFETKQIALDFIENRISKDINRKLDNYTLIYGQIIELKSVNVVTKIDTIE